MNDTTNHDAIRELLALRLYDELDPAEATRLDAHLTECSACRAFGKELESGLGSLGTAGEVEALPADWRARLERSVEAAPRPARRLQPLWTFAAGLAAGLLAMALIRGGAEPRTPGFEGPGHPLISAPALTTSRVTNDERAAHPLLAGALLEPPPRSTGGGQLAYLGTVLRNQ